MPAWDSTAFRAPQNTPRKKPAAFDPEAVIQEEGAAELAPVIRAIYGQESSSGANAATSVDGARGGMQVIPATFARFSRPGESIDDPVDNFRAGTRYIKHLASRFGNDPDRIAAGYFSGEGNVAAEGPAAWREDRRDGNGVAVSEYVADIRGKMGLPGLEATPAEAPRKSYPKWAEVAANPKFQALSRAEKDQVRREYFLDNVAPQLAAADIEQTWAQFDQETALPSVVDEVVASGTEKLKELGAELPGAAKRLADNMLDPFGRKAPASVMAGFVPSSAPARRGPPVRPEVQSQIQHTWERASPEHRAKLEAAPGWVGDIARSVAKRYAAQPDLPAAQAVDARREHRIRREVLAGATPETAANMVDTNAAGGSVRETPETLADKLGRMAGERTDLAPAEAIVRGAVDLAGSVAKVAPTTAKMVLDAAQLIPLIGQAAEIGSDALAEVIEGIARRQSRELQGEALKLAEVVRNGTPDQVMQQLVQNPDLLADVAIPSAGSIFLAGGAGAATGRAVASRYAGQVSERALARIQQRAATDGAVWANVALNAGDAYDSTPGSNTAKYVAALIAALGTRAAGGLTRGGAEGVIARGGAGEGNRLAAAGATSAREVAQEFGEGASGAAGTQTGELVTGQREDINLRQIANQGVLEAAAAGPVGAAVGMASAAPRGAEKAQQERIEPTARSGVPAAPEPDRREPTIGGKPLAEFSPKGLEILQTLHPDPETQRIAADELARRQAAAAPAADAQPQAPGEAGAIDQEGLLAQARAATAPERVQADPGEVATAPERVPAAPEGLEEISPRAPEREAASTPESTPSESPTARADVAMMRAQLQASRWAPTSTAYTDQAPNTVATFRRKDGASIARHILQKRNPNANLQVLKRGTSWALVLMEDGQATAPEGVAGQEESAASPELQKDSTQPRSPLAERISVELRRAAARKKAAPEEVMSQGNTAPVPLDHGELNIPGRTNGINAELDRFKREQARDAKAQAKTEAALEVRFGPKFDLATLRAELDSMVKWEPAKFIAFAKKFEAEQAAATEDVRIAPLFRVVRPDGTVFGEYVDPRDAEGAVGRAGPGAQIEPIATPVPPAPEAPTAEPLLMKNGKPFGSAKEAALSARLRKLDMAPVAVSGGWGLVPRSEAPAAPQAAAPTVEATPPAPTVETAPAPGVERIEPAARVKRAKTADGRAALLEEVEAAKRQTGDPVAVAEYQDLVARVKEARRVAGLKKTPAKKAADLTRWADSAEASELPKLRERIGVVTFKMGGASYRVLRTTANLDAFAKKVRATAAFKSLPPLETIYERIETRHGTTDGQRKTGRDALHDLARRLTARAHRDGLPEGGGAVTVLGAQLYEGFAATGGNRLVGQRVESPADLAALAQVYRDPRYETFRLFYTDANGVVIGEAGYSNRLPAAVYLPNIVSDIQRDAAAYGAKGAWLLHNHPSGRAQPSPSDLELTKSIAAAVPGFRGHVVIDHNEYAAIDSDGTSRVIAAPELNGVDFHSKPELAHQLLGLKIEGPQQVAEIAKALQIEGGHATVVFTRRAGEVQLLVDLPTVLLQDKTKVGIAKLEGVVRRMARAAGAGGNRFVVLPEGAPSEDLRFLIEQGIFIDVVRADGHSLNAVGTWWPGDFMDKDMKPAMRVAEGEAGLYSQLARAVAGVPARFASQPASQWRLWLATNSGRVGLERGQIQSSGVTEWLRQQGTRKVTTDEIGAYLQALQHPTAHGQRAAAAGPYDHEVLEAESVREFAGEYAATADHLALATAKQRIEAGEDAEAVRQDTGWHRGRDGKWRFEISDEDVRLIEPIKDDSQRVGEVLAADKLFAAYPYLRNVQVRIDDTMKSGDAAYYPQQGQILLSQMSADETRTALLHELQHAIQGLEGFAVGGSPELMQQYGLRTPLPGFVAGLEKWNVTMREHGYPEARLIDPTKDLAVGIEELVLAELENQGDWLENTQDLFDHEVGDLRQKAFGERDVRKLQVFAPLNPLERFERYMESYKNYKHLAGEVEARNTEARRNLTEAQRRATPPSDTVDVPDSDVIVIFGGKVMKSTRPANAQQRPVPPDETLARRLQRRWQDKFGRFTVIQAWLREQGVQLTEQADVYRAEERMHGRAATKIQDFREERLQPIIKKIRAAGLHMDEVADFLHAQHAEERNAQIAKINSEMPDGGSGMTTAQARTKLAQYALRPELVQLANELRTITDDTRRTLLEAGIITQEMSDTWVAAYEHYVPLKGGPEEDSANLGTGKGLTVKQKNRRALGHGEREGGEWIIENILRDHERAILQAEKNRVGQSLLKLAIEAGHPDLITIGQPVKRQVLRDAKTYEVRYHGSVVEVFHNLADAQRYVGQEALKGGRSTKDFAIATSHDLDVVMAPSPVLEPNETQVYVKGHAIRVQFNDELLARAWNNMGAEHMNVVFRAAREINTWLSRAYTGYNPEFLGVNVMRDFSTGIANLTGEEGAAFAARTVRNYPKAFSELLRYAFSGNASNWIKQYRADGGTTGAAYLTDLERVGKNVQAAYDEYAGVVETWRNGGPLRAARAAARETVGVFVGWIERLNQAGENAMRLAAYRTAVEMGQSRVQAAALAKNATVNFNRQGELGQIMGALYLFFNPAVQGSASIAHALFRGKHKHQAQALTAGLVGLGYLIAATQGGGDEDEWERLGEFVKERYLPVWTGAGWAKIPIPYGYGFFVTLGRQLHALQHGEDASKVALHTAANFVSEFSVWGAVADPEGDEKNILFLLPTVPQIVAAPLINRTALGSPIYPESKFDQSRPDNLKMWRATQGTGWHWTAERLNAITGGNAVEKGWADVSPETLRYLWATATGGTGRFFTDTAALGWNLTFEGLPLADVEAREVPVIRKFAQATGDINGTRARFWRHAEEAREAYEAFGRAARVEDRTTRQTMVAKIRAERGEFIALGAAVDAYAKAIGAKRDAVQDVLADDTKSLAYKRALVKQLEREEAKLYDAFVAMFKERDAERKARQQGGK